MSDTIEFDFANFRAHLHKLAHPDTENPDASDLTQMVIEASRDYIKNILEVSEIEITTVRERSGFREERLRHVYASPPEVRDWFETTDQEWADTDKVRAEGIESITFNDPRAKPKCSICLEGPTCYCSVFKIVGRKIVRSKKKGIQPEYHIFPD